MISEQTHHYGPNFTLVQNTFLQTLLTELCQPETTQPQINRLIKKLYTGLVEVAANSVFSKESIQVDTRMTQTHPKNKLTAEVFSKNANVVSVNLARAGTFPSHICYDLLHSIFPANQIRQDHIFAARMTNNAQQVTGTHLGSYKIGGGVDNAYVLFPDPMGATGGTLTSAIDYYETQIEGRARAYIALHLIVTPEYLKRVLNHKSQVKVFALRVDRGLSPDPVLQSPLGLYWDQEKGLNDMQYIVPGAGGLGELLNNSYV